VKGAPNVPAYGRCLDASRWDGEGEGASGDLHLEGAHAGGADGHGVFDFGRGSAYFEVAYLAGHLDDFSLGGVEVEAGLVEAALQEAVSGRFTGLALIGLVNVVVDRRHLLAFGVLLGPGFGTPHTSCFLSSCHLTLTLCVGQGALLDRDMCSFSQQTRRLWLIRKNRLP
jgi:hypothetical protein